MAVISKQCKVFIIILLILTVIVLAITLPIFLTYKPKDKYEDVDIWEDMEFTFEDNANNTLVDKDTKNEVNRPNITQSDIVMQKDTKKNNISTYNNTDAE